MPHATTSHQALLSQHWVYPAPLCSRVLLCLGGGKMVLNVTVVVFFLVQFLHDPPKKRSVHKHFHSDAYG